MLLIARTGFGKSLTFQAYYASINMIALQLVQLSKLGVQQAARMTNIGGAKACLFTAETLDRDPRLLHEVRRCKYNHVLLGPEQEVSLWFKDILRDPNFAKHVGMVIIDETHVLSTWGVFRESITQIHQLHHLLPSRTLMYGCTGTLTQSQEKDFLANGGFRPADSTVLGLKIFRISVNRPELQIFICPIEKGKTRSYKQLYFILSGRVQDVNNPDWFEGGHILSRRPGNCSLWTSEATLYAPAHSQSYCFHRGTRLIKISAGYLRIWLLDLGYSAHKADRIVST